MLECTTSFHATCIYILLSIIMYFVFVALPTGYGKSLCYSCLPYVFDLIMCKEKQSIVVVVSPLVALMKDQVDSCTAKGLSAAYVSAEPGNENMNQGVLEGRYQLVFLSPEALFFSRRWREMLREEPYCSNLVAFVIGEAHCIKSGKS